MNILDVALCVRPVFDDFRLVLDDEPDMAVRRGRGHHRTVVIPMLSGTGVSLSRRTHDPILANRAGMFYTAIVA